MSNQIGSFSRLKFEHAGGGGAEFEKLPHFLMNVFGISGPAANHLVEIMENLGQAAEAERQAIAAEHEARQLTRCCGSFYEDPGGYVWANHGIKDDCPMHGQHPTAPGDKRLKTYVGADESKVEEVQQAMKNWSMWAAAEHDLDEKRRKRRRLEDAIENLHGMTKGEWWRRSGIYV